MGLIVVVVIIFCVGLALVCQSVVGWVKESGRTANSGRTNATTRLYVYQFHTILVLIRSPIALVTTALRVLVQI